MGLAGYLGPEVLAPFLLVLAGVAARTCRDTAVNKRMGQPR